MIEFINNLPAEVVGIKVSGTVTKNEYEEKFAPEMKERLSGKLEINYLVLLNTRLSNFDAGVWWDDFKLALDYYSRWRKVAIVSDDVTVARLMNVVGFMIPGKHKCFSLSDYEMAVAWLTDDGKSVKSFNIKNQKMKKQEFKNKVVVVTGASAGLGRAIAREFARHGATIALIARGQDGLNAAVHEVEQLGGRAHAFPVDVANPEMMEEIAQNIESQVGPIDVWINNAMVSVFGSLKQLEARDFKRVTEVTYLGQVYGTMAALKHMIPRNSGSIILVGSALAYRGIPLQSAYCGSKHAIHGFFESLRSELIHDQSKIKLNMVQLPAMNTTQFGFVKSYLPGKPKPMGRIYEPEVAARAILHLALHPRRELYVGYPTVQTIIGNKFIPGYLDKYLARTGFKGQQTDEPADPRRKNNLYEPVPGDHGAHGNFDTKAWDASPEVWAATHRTITVGAFAILGLSIFILCMKKIF